MSSGELGQESPGIPGLPGKVAGMLPREVIEALMKAKKYLAGRDGADRLLPKGRVVEVVYIGRVTNFSLFRTEGTSTIDTVELPDSKVATPVIMPQKIVAVARRRLTELLRRYANLSSNQSSSHMNSILCRAVRLGYIKAMEHLGFKPPEGFSYTDVNKIEFVKDNKIKVTYKKNKQTKTEEYSCSSELKPNWNCWIQPPLGQGTDLGMDTFCPACVIFGAVLTDSDNVNMRASGGSLNVGIKSRVVPDPAFALYPRYEFKTHQKVAEGTLSTTGTSLYKEPHWIPATLVVGKIAFYDVTVVELLAVLQALVSAYRYGGRQSRFGGLEVDPIALSAGPYERISALALAEGLVEEKMKPLDDAVKQALKLLGNKFTAVVQDDKTRVRHPLRDSLLAILDDEEAFKELYEALWEDALAFDEAVINRVNMLKGSGKKGGRK